MFELEKIMGKDQTRDALEQYGASSDHIAMRVFTLGDTPSLQSTTYILLLFSDLRILRAGVLRPSQMSAGDKNCGRAAGIHQLQHIQSTAETVQ
mgnify:CR=1 FL=1